MTPFFDPLSEYERIARNRPHPGINKSYPKNTDGTMAGIVDSLPKRVIQQLPSGKVETTQGTVMSIVANFVLYNDIIPNANLDADAIQKCWAVVSKSMTFGAIGTMNLFTKHDYSYGADFKYFYVKDGFFQSGKLTFQSCDYFFVRAWYQKSDIEAIIDRMQKQRKASRERGEAYDEEWNLPALKRLKDWCQEKAEEAKSSGEKERSARSEAIEVIHGFQKGVGAKFFSWATGPEEFICERVNKDPRGKMPVNYMYTTLDFENPLGRGVIEMSGGMQNVIDSMLQSYQYNRALMLAPPLIKRGNWDKSKAKLQPNAIIDLGSDENSTLEPLTLDTTALSNFTQDYGLFKSQILALNNNGDTSTSSEVGNPGFSKTSAGVQAQQLKLGVSDNYMRKQFEAWWSDNCETMLNIHFSNKHGLEEIELDDDTARKVREIDPELVTDDNKYTINYDEYTEMLRFTVDASTSDKESDEKQMENIDTILERVQNSPMLQAIMQQYPEKQAELYNKVIALSGVEDAEALQVDAKQFAEQIKQQQAMAEQQAAQQQMMQSQMAQQSQQLPQDAQQGSDQQMQPQQPQEEMSEIPDMQTLETAQDQPEEQGEEQLEPHEMMLVQGLQDRGLPDDVIEQAIVMMRQGIPDDEVLQVIAQSMQPQGGM